jgi:methionyl-tRNA formyltransferase
VTCDNINDPRLVQRIANLQPDIIVSFSAPQVMKKLLLEVPRFGIINVHGSYLPDYRGCFPSFWQLLNGEQYAGATVHVMSEKIDDGRILLQDKVPISDCRTIFEVIRRTKVLGGDLVVKAISKIENGDLSTIVNDSSKGHYYSWPTNVDTKTFREKGLRLI